MTGSGNRCDDGATFSLATLATAFSHTPACRYPPALPDVRPAARQSLTRKQVILMSTGIIVVIVVAVIVVAALVTGVMAIMRRRRLQQRFGPEYDRVSGERDSKLKADSELAERERRVRDLDIQPLTDAARASYAAQWADIQERFVDAPADAVTGSQLLVTAVMTDRGYPVEHHDQVLADLSVEHSDTLGHYRAAEEISQSAAADTASTEDLRQAMIHYRALFSDLLGDPANTGSESVASAADTSEQSTGSDPKEMAK
jgi:Tfp pilus assembly protein PilX